MAIYSPASLVLAALGAWGESLCLPLSSFNLHHESQELTQQKLAPASCAVTPKPWQAGLSASVQPLLGHSGGPPQVA